MRVNRQIHYEVTKYFYGDVILSLPSLFRLENNLLFEDNVPSVREAIAVISPDILPLFKQLSIHITGSSTAATFRRQPTRPPAILSYIFNTFTGLERVVISFGNPNPHTFVGQEQPSAQQPFVEQMKSRLFDQIPNSVNVSWSHEDAARFFHSGALEQRLWRAVQERGSTNT